MKRKNVFATESQKRYIWNGPDESGLAQSLISESEVDFWILGGSEDPGITQPEKLPCVVRGIERSLETMEYHLAVQVIGLKTPAWQFFRYSPTTYRGEWVGCLDIGHKAYEGHSFRI